MTHPLIHWLQTRFRDFLHAPGETSDFPVVRSSRTGLMASSEMAVFPPVSSPAPARRPFTTLYARGEADPKRFQRFVAMNRDGQYIALRRPAHKRRPVR